MNDATFNASREFVRYVAKHGLRAALYVYGMTMQEAKGVILRVRITVSLRMAKRERSYGAYCKRNARDLLKAGKSAYAVRWYESHSRKAYRQATRYARQAMQASLRQA